MAKARLNSRRSHPIGCLAAAGWSLALLACEPETFAPKPPIIPSKTSPASSLQLQPGSKLNANQKANASGTKSGSSAAPSASPLPPPKAFQLDEPFSPPQNGAQPDETSVILFGGWTWRGRPDPAPEAKGAGVAQAKLSTAADWRIALSAGPRGRMRIALTSRGFSLKPGSELLALQERYGTIVSWPGRTRYRVLAPGSVRPLLDEGRADVVPLAKGVATPKGTSRRADRKTKKWLVSSPIGELDLEVTQLPEAPESGALLCRLFLELVGVHPSNEVCQAKEVPMFASYRWRIDDTVRSGNWFEVTRIKTSPAVPEPPLIIPPPNAEATTQGLPRPSNKLLLTKNERAALRTTKPGTTSKSSLLRNGSSRALYLLLDGAPLAWVEPNDKLILHGMPPGRYKVQWRSFLGDVVSETTETLLPGRIDHKVIDHQNAVSAAPSASATSRVDAPKSAN